MKILLLKDEDYLILTENVEKSNIEDYLSKTEMINSVMDKLEELKLKLEAERQLLNPCKVKKLGLHPDMK